MQGVLVLTAWLVGMALCDVIVYDKSYTIIDEFNDLPARFGPLFPLEGKWHAMRLHFSFIKLSFKVCKRTP